LFSQKGARNFNSFICARLKAGGIIYKNRFFENYSMSRGRELNGSMS